MVSRRSTEHHRGGDHPPPTRLAAQVAWRGQGVVRTRARGGEGGGRRGGRPLSAGDACASTPWGGLTSHARRASRHLSLPHVVEGCQGHAFKGCVLASRGRNCVASLVLAWCTCMILIVLMQAHGLLCSVGLEFGERVCVRMRV